MGSYAKWGDDDDDCDAPVRCVFILFDLASAAGNCTRDLSVFERIVFLVDGMDMKGDER